MDKPINDVISEANHIELYNNKKIHVEKLFPKINGVNLQHLIIDYESVSYITTPNESKKISDIIAQKMVQYKPIKECNVVDATAGVGGDSIMLCSIFGSVISIEMNHLRYAFLKHNLEQYNFKNVTPINGDSLIIVPKLQFIDVIYVDPPWGGKNYKMKENLRLMLGDIYIETFVENCFNKNIMMFSPKLIVLKLPKNYDLKSLFEILGSQFDIYLYELKKINILLIEKKLNV
jgi:predicted RNA methylase